MVGSEITMVMQSSSLMTQVVVQQNQRAKLAPHVGHVLLAQLVVPAKHGQLKLPVQHLGHHSAMNLFLGNKRVL